MSTTSHESPRRWADLAGRAHGNERAQGAPFVFLLAGTSTGSDGEQQVTYNGDPLYLYAGDEKAGDTRGEGLTDFGANWYVLSPAGQQVSGQASRSYGSGSGGA
jgi:predicted lipoprotein with Yx(FWY)xxD motif